MSNFPRLLSAAFLIMAASGCGGGSALQPDRSIFSLDNNYQRRAYDLPIEDTFEQTVSVFRGAGYKLDVIDRATGQISGIRGASGDKGSSTDKDIKFYALVLPNGSGSELGIKIVQILRRGTIGTSRAELIVNDAAMYQYLFKRIENTSASSVASDRAAPVPGMSVYPEF